MAMSNIVDYVWNNMLEEVGSDTKPDFLRQLNCGCIVLRDGDYLDLYVWNSGERACTENYGHEMINLLYDAAMTAAGGEELEGEAHQEFMTLVRRYTNGWGEQDDILTALAAL